MAENKIDKNLPNNQEKIPIQPNSPETTDGKFESPSRNQENLDKSLEKTLITEEKPSEKILPSSSSLIQSNISKREKEIENILEVDLADVYMKLSPSKKIEFKLKGEETAKAINSLLDNTKVKVKKVLSLIKDWLKLIPGVNSFFIEQLAKSKLDDIMKLKNKQNGG